MATLIIPTPLRKYAADQAKFVTDSLTIEEAIDELTAEYPDLKTHLLDGNDQIRSFIKVFVGEDDIKSLDGPSGVTQDVTDLHAWAEVYIPGAGWIGLDATSGMLAGEGYIPLSCTASPGNASPITGSLEACETEMDVFMEVLRIDEKPRSTKPYQESTWQDILKAGYIIDKTIQEEDIRLSIGGEPTFVSIDDMEGAEWNTLAVGEHKRERSEDLIKRLAKRFAPNGLLHYGQGKWYPGEPIPRWSLSVYWRKDGQALWHNQNLIAETDEDLGHNADHAKSILRGIATELGAPTEWIFPAFNPPEWPGGPMGDICGYVLPLHRNPNPGWVSGDSRINYQGPRSTEFPSKSSF